MTTSSSLTYDDLGSAAQRDRRRRILDATLALAEKGGFEAVQMRAVAERADVALGTLYRYFPSKIHLLVSGLSLQFEQTSAAIAKRPVPGDTPADRVSYVLAKATRGLQRRPQLTEALTRAFMFADASVAGEIEIVCMQLTQMLHRAIEGQEYVEGSSPSEQNRAITRVLSDVWLAAVVGWVTGRSSMDEVSDRVETAVRLILR